MMNKKGAEDVQVDDMKMMDNSKSFNNIWHKYKGRAIAVFSAIMSSVTIPLFKYFFNENTPVAQALMIRYVPPLIIILFIGFFMKCIKRDKNWSIFADNWNSFKILFIRSILHFLSNLCWLTSLSVLPIAINVPIAWSWQLFAVILGHIVLHEKV